jgi:hypothetical protein
MRRLGSAADAGPRGPEVSFYRGTAALGAISVADEIAWSGLQRRRATGRQRHSDSSGRTGCLHPEQITLFCLL